MHVTCITFFNKDLMRQALSFSQLYKRGKGDKEWLPEDSNSGAGLEPGNRTPEQPSYMPSKIQTLPSFCASHLPHPSSQLSHNPRTGGR